MRTPIQKRLFDELEPEVKAVREAETLKTIRESWCQTFARAWRMWQDCFDAKSFELGLQRFIFLTKLYAGICKVMGGYAQQPPVGVGGETLDGVLARIIRALLNTSGLTGEAWRTQNLIWWAACAATVTLIWLASRNQSRRRILSPILRRVVGRGLAILCQLCERIRIALTRQ